MILNIILKLIKKDIKFDIDLDINEIPFKIDLINFVKNDNEIANLKLLVKERIKIFFKKINIKKNNDIINLNNIYFL